MLLIYPIGPFPTGPLCQHGLLTPEHGKPLDVRTLTCSGPCPNTLNILESQEPSASPSTASSLIKNNHGSAWKRCGHLQDSEKHPSKHKVKIRPEPSEPYVCTDSSWKGWLSIHRSHRSSPRPAHLPQPLLGPGRGAQGDGINQDPTALLFNLADSRTENAQWSPW